jgi:hypothetical protein
MCKEADVFGCLAAIFLEGEWKRTIKSRRVS